jgi:hypothetical protein
MPNCAALAHARVQSCLESVRTTLARHLTSCRVPLSRRLSTFTCTTLHVECAITTVHAVWQLDGPVPAPAYPRRSGFTTPSSCMPMWLGSTCWQDPGPLLRHKPALHLLKKVAEKKEDEKEDKRAIDEARFLASGHGVGAESVSLVGREARNLSLLHLERALVSTTHWAHPVPW